MPVINLAQHKKKEEYSRPLYTDPLIKSAFQFIALYIGNDTKPNDIYNQSISHLAQLIIDNKPPQHDTYICDQKLWNKYVIGDLDNLEDLQAKLEEEDRTTIKKIRNTLLNINFNFYLYFDEQEILDYSTYMFLDNFLQFIDKGKSVIEFPEPTQVLKRKNLEPIIRKALWKKSNLTFLANNTHSLDEAIGFRK